MVSGHCAVVLSVVVQVFLLSASRPFSHSLCLLLFSAVDVSRVSSATLRPLSSFLFH